MLFFNASWYTFSALQNSNITKALLKDTISDEDVGTLMIGDRATQILKTNFIKEKIFFYHVLFFQRVDMHIGERSEQRGMKIHLLIEYQLKIDIDE